MRILFVGTDASLSGSPQVLEHLEAYIGANPGIRIGTLLLRGGPRLARYREFGPTVILSRRKYSLPLRARHLRKRVLRIAARQAIGPLRSIDLIYVSTLSTRGIEAPVIDGAKCTVVTHAHELRHWIDRESDIAAVEQLLAISAVVFADSKAHQDYLADRFSVNPTKMMVARGPIDASELAGPELQRSLRLELSIPASAFVVGGSGSLDWSKGPDLFLRLASSLIRTRRGTEPELHFVWFGGHGLALADMVEETRKSGLANHVHLMGTRPDARLLFPEFDLFALTSREEAGPLVMLEAAAAGLPIVAFESSGGAGEFLAGGTGATVPYGDVEGMADVIGGFMDDAEGRARVGQRARAQAARYDLSIVGADIVNRLQSIPAIAAVWPRASTQ